MRPLLDEAVQESIVTMEKITVDTVCRQVIDLCMEFKDNAIISLA